jgi:predicted transcriptional regulator
MAKEAIIVIGRKSGIQNGELADALGLDPSAVSKRWEAARGRAEDSHEMVELLRKIRSMV